MSESILVHGVGVAGAATVKALVKRGYEVVASDDAPTAAKRKAMATLGVEFVEAPDARRLMTLVDRSLLPGFPQTISASTDNFGVTLFTDGR